GLAMAALHDGYALAFGASPLLPPSTGSVPIGTNPVLAGGAACHEILSIRYPTQAAGLRRAWQTWREMNSPGLLGATAEAYGRALGRIVEALGAEDAESAVPVGYQPRGEPYTHAASPREFNQGFAGPHWGGVVPLLASRIAGFPPPPGRLSARCV